MREACCSLQAVRNLTDPFCQQNVPYNIPFPFAIILQNQGHVANVIESLGLTHKLGDVLRGVLCLRERQESLEALNVFAADFIIEDVCHLVRGDLFAR